MKATNLLQAKGMAEQQRVGAHEDERVDDVPEHAE
jgi:hypothetical protein